MLRVAQKLHGVFRQADGSGLGYGDDGHVGLAFEGSFAVALVTKVRKEAVDVALEELEPSGNAYRARQRPAHDEDAKLHGGNGEAVGHGVKGSSLFGVE
jgi:hypothetical protein